MAVNDDDTPADEPFIVLEGEELEQALLTLALLVQDGQAFFELDQYLSPRQISIAQKVLAAYLAKVHPGDAGLNYLRDFDPQTVHEIPKGTPFAVYVSETNEAQGETAGYIPSVVYQDVSGHFPLTGPDSGQPWVWGPTLADAKAQAQRYNEGLGLTPGDAMRIIASSFTMARKQGKL